jgi:hypothetical protein
VSQHASQALSKAHSRTGSDEAAFVPVGVAETATTRAEWLGIPTRSGELK